jgi:hypothetical protein
MIFCLHSVKHCRLQQQLAAQGEVGGAGWDCVDVRSLAAKFRTAILVAPKKWPTRVYWTQKSSTRRSSPLAMWLQNSPITGVETHLHSHSDSWV